MEVRKEQSFLEHASLDGVSGRTVPTVCEEETHPSRAETQLLPDRTTLDHLAAPSPGVFPLYGRGEAFSWTFCFPARHSKTRQQDQHKGTGQKKEKNQPPVAFFPSQASAAGGPREVHAPL